MKILCVTLILVLYAVPSFAGSCSDTQSAASTAIKERNAVVKEIHNTTMPDPEEERLLHHDLPHDCRAVCAACVVCLQSWVH
ncbi:MAG: hypothetical protein PHN64_02305 [Desulfovibrionaceae bacterium]|nr:hypothetical protein [Desulfovibrionaceae bacterium]